MTTLHSDLAAVLALEQRATAGEWKTCDDSDGGSVWIPYATKPSGGGEAIITGRETLCDCYGTNSGKANSALIAAARNFLHKHGAELLSLQERLEGALESLRAEAHAIEDRYNADDYSGDLDMDEAQAETIWACIRTVRAAMDNDI